MADDEVEQTLHIAREVKMYTIPPRHAADGYRSGEWKVADNIFTGRMRIIARGTLCEIRVEDPHNGDLFAVCPIPEGKRTAYVENTTDSSRYFVIRVEDPDTKRHAFLGLGFENRGDAFDFSEALMRHERQVQREKAAYALSQGAPVSNAPTVAAVESEVKALYEQHGDLGLKEGQTIRVNLKSKPAQSGGFFSSSGSKTPLLPLGPPSAPPAAPLVQQQSARPVQASSWSLDDILGNSSSVAQHAPPASLPGVPAAAGQPVQQQSPASIITTTAPSEGWATFD